MELVLKPEESVAAAGSHGKGAVERRTDVVLNGPTTSVDVCNGLSVFADGLDESQHNELGPQLHRGDESLASTVDRVPMPDRNDCRLRQAEMARPRVVPHFDAAYGSGLHELDDDCAADPRAARTEVPFLSVQAGSSASKNDGELR